MRTKCLTNRRICWSIGLVCGLKVKRHKALALHLGDMDVAMGVDKSGKAAQLTGEPVWTAEGLYLERRKMIDVKGVALAEKGL